MTGESEHVPAVGADRLQTTVLFAASGAMLVLGRWLEPSPLGLGTHAQLGFPPCLFLKFTGIPCPNCGLTTSFAHASRLQFIQAFLTQPFGLIVFLLAATTAVFACYSLLTRRPMPIQLNPGPNKTVWYSLAACYVLGWIYKIFAVMQLY
ncbi:MAG: DUF2752 domain-containing protein [Acidobacteria bacterium]|nr:DUF2752 domain-containing protein [Acidobacteriota bacterium]